MRKYPIPLTPVSLSIVTIVIVVAAALCAGSWKQLREINKMVKESSPIFGSKHPILEDHSRLLRLLTGKSNSVEISFGPGEYGRFEIKSEATNTHFLIHTDRYKSGAWRSVFTNQIILNAHDETANRNNGYYIDGFMFDGNRRNTNDYAVKF